jgi:hypothetical protein
MITSLPAVQFSCKRAYRIIQKGRRNARWQKQHANRGHRRFLNRATRAFVHDPERFDGEAFDAPSLSSWDLC